MSAIRRFLILAVLAVAACAPVYRNHGYVPPELDLAAVIVGQTTVDELPTLIGRPSSQGLLTGSGWYYVGSRWRHYGPYEPEEIERQVVAVTFAETGTVANVERFGLERGRVVALSRRVTDSGIADVSLIRQLMGNLGNFTAGQLID
ncbi:outer membrane protein assembly factor BamE [Paracoccus tegillarcae]|uniref:Outer membrane protein assembly factor BamE n=1 Tax=Paracoccus tegillarcae TaxID=1529068 RepID=A0A2K9EKT4_9RHOB|nr:outer membrane protein assembly factor BamE [Paracoccus tegillarcae]AUH32195.1 outer membrane protein assembly factor BamE [Paracoccus tegillarcae]